MAKASYTIHIMQDPHSVELNRHSASSYYHVTDGTIKEGWYFYYEREDGLVSQLFGPFKTQLAAQGCANSDTYRVNKQHDWLALDKHSTY